MIFIAVNASCKLIVSFTEEKNMNIKNAVVLVTGSNRGLGKALVESLISAGAKKVYATARNTQELNFGSVKSEVELLALDITDQLSIQKAAVKARDVTLLINNAGVLEFGDILEVPVDRIKHSLEVNFYGSLAMSKQFAPIIESNGGGAIVNILTLLSLASMPGLSAYNASKAAEWSMSLSLRASLKDKMVDVHNVFPGAVNTDMLRAVEMDKTDPAEVANNIVEGVNQGLEDIFPDPMSKEVYQQWCKDHKSVERQFSQM